VHARYQLAAAGPAPVTIAVPSALLCLLLCLIAAGPRSATAQDTPPAPVPAYDLVASVTMSRGYISQAGWLDDQNLLTLVITPESVEVWQTNIDTLDRDRFISSSLITGNICPLSLASRLSWTISPGRNYIFFKWFGDDGARHWALLDIADAPRFRLKQFAAPAGMQISRVLFSADDRLAVLIDDSFIEGSSVSVLVMDLEAGREIWRIPSQQLSFIADEWWRSDSGPGVLALGASLYDGEFYPTASIATADIARQTIEYTPDPHQLITATGASWGWAACSQLDGRPDAGYYLEVHEDGATSSRLELDLRPINLLALDTPGCVLLVNSADLVTSKLWLVSSADMLEPVPLDADCRDLALSPGGRLLVLSGATNEIRIYEPR
jgi:WD40 repeat protein